VADEPDTLERIRSATAMCDEPEAPGRDWVDAQGELAAEHNRLRHLKAVEERRAIRATLDVEVRMRDAVHRAKRQHVDVSREMYVLARMLQKGSRQAASNRLEHLEARLDGVA
jgi:hypothetical protein